MSTTVNQPVARLTDVAKRFVLHKDKSLKDRALYFSSRRKSRSDFWALRDVSVQIELGETVGLIGHNGSGKSTLLKIIGGIIEPTSGIVERRGRVAALLELGAGFHPDLSGRENVYLNAAILGMSKEHTDRVFDDIVDFSGIGEFIDSQVKFYSSGMYVRLAFAVAVHSDPDLLLVDEVLAVGDEPFQLKCLTKIREFQREGRTIVLVSHSADQVADICTRVIVLDGGHVVHDGEVGEGIRVLREGYERDRVDELREAATRNHELTGEPVTITRAAVVHPDGSALSRPVTLGSDLQVEIDAVVHVPLKWITGFTLATTLGQTVYRLNTEGLGIELPSEPGSYRISFALPATNFSAGQLMFSAGATTDDGRPIAHFEAEQHIDVQHDPAGAGMVQFAVSGQVDALPSS